MRPHHGLEMLKRHTGLYQAALIVTDHSLVTLKRRAGLYQAAMSQAHRALVLRNFSEWLTLFQIALRVARRAADQIALYLHAP